MVSLVRLKSSSFKALCIPIGVFLVPFSGIAGEGDPVAAAQGSGLLTIDWIIIAAFPHFIAYHLPPVASGLVMAGLFAAAMSSVDSGVNSITAVVMTDFLNRFRLKPKSERKHVLFARGLAVGIGIIIVLASAVMKHVPGNIIAVTQKTVNLLTVPIFLLFFFALFIPFANPVGVWIGVLCSIATATLISFSGLIFGMTAEGLDPVSFQWISPAALIVGISVGTLACKVLSGSRREMANS